MTAPPSIKTGWRIFRKLTALDIKLLAQNSCRFFRKVRQDQLRARATDRRERFDDHAVAVQPSVGDGGLQHRVFSGNLISRDRQIKAAARLADHVEVRHGGFY